MFRKLICGLAVSALAWPALAQDEVASTEAIYACAGIETADERLACYDQAVGRLQAAEQAGEVTTITRAEVEEVQRESFGFSLPSLPRLAMPSLGGESDEIDRVTLPVRTVRADAYGKALVTLENGQVWRQTDSTYVRQIRVGAEQAVIRRAALGSFRMKLDNGRTFRAKREQ